MFPQWIIEKKRDGLSLTPEEIGFFVRGYVAGTIPDYQMAALAMAIAIRGMTVDETACLTKCMLASGQVINTASINKPKIDKHSTGGVGDKISLVLAPLVACCGVAVPMISGRGLGITGGTLDKLESIPGYRTRIEEDEFARIIRECGCSIMGASERIAPADKKMYALRDVTGTVPSIPLIVSSILSKKMAAGLDGLVIDVKCGEGAFMKTLPEAQSLAAALVAVAKGAGLPATALISGMQQPLGRAVGNGLEITETVETLKGNGPSDVVELTLALGEKMLGLAGITTDKKAARRMLETKLQSGEAFERFSRMVKLHGGETACLERTDSLPRAALKDSVNAPSSGYIAVLNAGLIGRSALALGAGRSKMTDKIDHGAGIICLKKIGDKVDRGEPLAILYGSSGASMELAKPMAAGAFKITERKTEPPKLIVGEI